MSQNLLILGGTSEATHLSKLVALAKINATLSFAGRVKRTKPQPIPIRIGGFGGPEGLCDYIVQNKPGTDERRHQRELLNCRKVRKRRAFYRGYFFILLQKKKIKL